jgi:hypothetical protein
MVASLNDVYEFIATEVANDPYLTSINHNTIWSHQAPEMARTPYFIMHKQTGGFNFTLNSGRAYDQNMITIKSVTEATHDSGDGGALGRDAMSRLRELIVFQRPTLSSGYTMVIQENNDFEYREAESGNVLIYHVGIVFRIMLGH